MGSVQQCFSWELVAASIIWHRLQPCVTFALQDGWLCTVWTLLSLSHWWASRRGYERNAFPTSCCSKKEEEIHRCGAMWFFSSIYLLNLNFVSHIETHTLWKLTYEKSYPKDIEFAQTTAEIMPSAATDEKCYPPPAKLLICFPHRFLWFHLLLISMHHLNSSEYGDSEVGIILVQHPLEMWQWVIGMSCYMHRLQ